MSRGTIQSFEESKQNKQDRQHPAEDGDKSTESTTVTRREGSAGPGESGASVYIELSSLTPATVTRYLINERPSLSSFARAFFFNHPLDPKTVKARMENGVLQIQVEKAVGCAAFFSVKECLS